MRGSIALFSLLAACSQQQPHVTVAALAPIASSAPPAVSAPPAPPPEPAKVERVDVPKDSAASFVRGAPGTSTHVVFMPGVCSNAYAYLLSFPEAARAHGGVVAIDGDEPCPGVKGFHSFSWNPTLQRARIEAALAAANVPVPADGLTLVGYSAGASIAELMHQRWPKLFPRLVLIAPPVDPSVARLRDARAVALMSCSWDVPYRMKAAATALGKVHVPATYLEMPKCTHGNIADGEHVFGEAFDWLDSQP
ncbi:MAG TPA: alpha/beta hydrolase [Polyangiaceae bacterium]|jgi:pimeloyl-ACP methyl ester carboxylesterase